LRWRVAPAGSQAGAVSAFPRGAPTEGFFFLISRISKSALSACGKARRFVSDHGRVPVAAGAVAVVAGIGTAGAVAGPAPSAGAAAHLAAYTGPAALGGQHQAGPGSAKQPYVMYDSVDPSAVPAGQRMATYVDGPYAVSASQVAGHGSVLWIDTNGSSPKAASALDVEPGDATPAGAAQWVQQKLTASPDSTAVVYTMRSEWPQVQSAISSLPSGMQSHVKYWIADPTGVPHMVPGASATQWYWGSSYDISTATPGF
jgi:hypothetical protein